jgi:hypothetical protein
MADQDAAARKAAQDVQDARERNEARAAGLIYLTVVALYVISELIS